VNLVLALLLSPLLLGVIHRIKAWFAGRSGRPLLQTYFDLLRLLRKGAVYSTTTSWVFRAGPIVGLASALLALALVPLGGLPALLAFPGDLVAVAYLLGLARLFTVLAALDTGSSFEAMGASRELTFSALAEPALLLGLASVARLTGDWSLSGMFTALDAERWAQAGPALVLVALALLSVFLLENARIPFDDPNTHLELTMIHELMVLDHSGPDLAFIELGSTLRLWLLGSLIVGVAVPLRSGSLWLDAAGAVLGLIALCVIVGVIESAMARLKLLRVPQFTIGAALLAVLSLILVVGTELPP
jgi:formate hydrogenlyase subunit 4